MKKFNRQTMSNEALFYHFSVFGDHAAGVEICDRANNNDLDALKYSKKVHEIVKIIK